MIERDHVIPYCSQTGTRSTLEELRAKGWRLLLSAGGHWASHGFRYGCDNGAWRTWRQFKAGRRRTPDPDLDLFHKLVHRMGPGADFLVVPDIVEGGQGSWALSRYWLRELRRDWRLARVRLLIAVQDGMTPDLVQRFVGERVGLFIGGSTEWKMSTLASRAGLARSRGAWCHVGRVNTARRIKACEEAGVTSWDGSSAAMFPKTLPFLDRERHKRSLIGEAARRAPAMSPEEFAMRCRRILDEETGHARYRAFDSLCEQALRTTGYGHGVAIFESGIADWHQPSHGYPHARRCPDCEAQGHPRGRPQQSVDSARPPKCRLALPSAT